MWDSISPAGPPPMIATWVRTTAPVTELLRPFKSRNRRGVNFMDHGSVY
jgi:hypothetical protein